MEKLFFNIKWQNLIDLPYSDIQKLNDLEKILHEKQEKTFNNNDNSEEFLYESFLNYGISLSFKDKRLFSVYLYSIYDKKFKKYPGSLPYNLSFELNNQDIVSKFGEPNQKFGGKTIPIGISYDNLGLEINFVSNNWNDNLSPISFVCLFKPENNASKSICGVCGKSSDSLCGKCKLIKYCSTKCQKFHWNFHKKFCLE